MLPGCGLPYLLRKVFTECANATFTLKKLTGKNATATAAKPYSANTHH